MCDDAGVGTTRTVTTGYLLRTVAAFSVAKGAGALNRPFLASGMKKGRPYIARFDEGN